MNPGEYQMLHEKTQNNKLIEMKSLRSAYKNSWRTVLINPMSERRRCTKAVRLIVINNKERSCKHNIEMLSLF